MMGVVVGPKKGICYKIGYNDFEWHVGTFDTVLEAGRAFGKL